MTSSVKKMASQRVSSGNLTGFYYVGTTQLSSTQDLVKTVKYQRDNLLISETEEQQRLRFQTELEFVQCLANPNYLNFLAQRGYFKDPCFINYLKYLQYWKEPKYAKYLKYPQSLHFLDLMQYEHFRKELVNAQCAKFIDDQQLLHWQHYQRKRVQLLNAQAEQADKAKESKPNV